MAFGYAVFFTERSRNRVIRWDPDTGDVEVVAGEPVDGDPSQELNDPYGLAFDSDGQLLIADKLNRRICRLRQGRLEAIPLRDVDGHRSRLPNTSRCYDPALLSPTGLLTEPDGALICSFADDYTIYRIHQDGSLEHLLGMLRNRNPRFSKTDEVVPPEKVRDTMILGPTGIVQRSDGTLFFIERRPQIVREYHPSRGLRCVFPLALGPAFRVRDSAPLSAPIQEYHPAFPGSLALDLEERLYLADVQHGCVLLIDQEKGEVRRVVSLQNRTHPTAGGVSAVSFGPDGTAWVLDSFQQVVQGYRPRPDGDWIPTSQALTAIGGRSLELPHAGSGIAIGA